MSTTEYPDFHPITLRVIGDPKAQPRHRSAVRKRPKGYTGPQRAMTYDPGTADGWKALVIQQARRVHTMETPEKYVAYGKRMPAAPLEGPLYVCIDLYFKRPKRLMRRCDPEGPVAHFVKPDRDNSDKSILDALTQSGIWRDDCQVCQGEIRKWYAGKTQQLGALITIRRAVYTAKRLALRVVGEE